MPLLAEMHPSWAVRWTLTLSADHRGVLHDRLGEPWLERRGEGAWLLDASGPPELSGVPGLPEGHLVPSLNGAPLWRTREQELRRLSKPDELLLGEDTVDELAKAVQLDDTAVLVERPGGLLGPSVACRDLITGAVRWTTRGELLGRVVPLDGAVLVRRGGRDGRLLCVDGGTGKVRWRASPGPACEPLVVSAGHLWVMTEDREVHAVSLGGGRIVSSVGLDFRPDAGSFLPWDGGVLTVGRGATLHLRPGEEPVRSAFYNPMHLPMSQSWRLEALASDGVALASDRGGRLLRLDPSLPIEPMRRARPTSVAFAGLGGAAILGRASDGERLYLLGTGRRRGQEAWLACLDQAGGDSSTG